ncbi:PLP-dependent aminotransferase family protein [Endozoicomonas sp. SM1973]|uniref:PLP-dependent aminotransferase family protein n=1 Tax=Spartinivicinus marinus TaxID=2994442 RepID=A0A853IIB5_9GAMM|nr:PLP-dependent aminotransferase family protein [Spartinivicinus marinus]MCX4029299.1 PLP-dependent aminotransferase family protein [Spartinivicinus marinus]NYZ69147.1 PLP-dependent aminotransferase family protein [Spartinivicinus marinus]
MSYRYQKLYQYLRDAINEGHYKPGQRLPASRTLAKEQGLSRNTVVRVYEMLISEGYLTSHIGDGMRVSHNLPDTPWLTDQHSQRASVEPNWSCWGQRLLTLPHSYDQYREKTTPSDASLMIDFQYGHIEMSESIRLQWRRLASKWSYLQTQAYGDPQGLLELRKALATHLTTYRGCHTNEEQLVIGSSAQHLFALIIQLITEPGDTVVIEEPWYKRFRDLLLLANINVISVPVDDQGLCLDQLQQKTINQGIIPKLIYVTPSHQFPAGVVMSLHRRLALLDWCNKQQCWIIEDDYDSEFRYSGPPIDALQSLDKEGRVMYVGTTSKVICPSLRIAYGIFPPPWIKPMCRAINLGFRHSSWMEQHMLAECINNGSYVSHIRRQRRLYDSNRMILVNALTTHFGESIQIQGESAGLHLLLWLKNFSGQHQQMVVQSLKKAGIAVYPIDHLYSTPQQHLGLMMGYATLSHPQIEQGVLKMKKVLGKLPRRNNSV